MNDKQQFVRDFIVAYVESWSSRAHISDDEMRYFLPAQEAERVAQCAWESLGWEKKDDEIVQLREELLEHAVRYVELLPDGKKIGFVCEVCGAEGNDRISLIHKPYCITQENHA